MKHYILVLLTIGLFCVPTFAATIIFQSQSSTPLPTPTPLTTPSAVTVVASSPNTPNTSATNTIATDNDTIPFMQNNKAEEVSPPSNISLLGRTVGALVVILGLLFGAAYVGKYFYKPNPTNSNQPVQLINTIALGDKRTLAVVRFQDKLLLLGTTSQSINLIASTDYVTEEITTDQPVGRPVIEILQNDKFADELLSASQRQ